MNIQQTFRQAYQLHQGGNLSAAEKLYRDVLSSNPLHGDAMRFLGLALCQAGKVEDGIGVLTKASQLEGTRVEALNDLAVVYIQQRAFMEAEESLTKALHYERRHVQALTNLAGLYFLTEQVANAVKTYELAIDAAPKDFGLRLGYAKALDECGREEDAIAQCDLILRHHPTASTVLATKGACLTAAGRYEEAADVLADAVGHDPSLVLAHANLGFCHLQTNNEKAARQVLLTAVAQDPENPRVAALLSHTLSQCGEAQGALERCLSFLSRHQGNADVLSVLPTVYNVLNRNDDAARLLNLDQLLQLAELSLPDGFEDISAFNHELANHIRNDSTLLRSPTSKSTEGGLQTSYLRRGSSHALAMLIDSFKATVNRYLREIDEIGLGGHPAFINRPGKWEIHAWGVVLKDGGHQKSHIHPSAWISGVYHVELPSTGMNEETGTDGWLEFGRPLYEGDPTADDAVIRLIRPVPGTAVLFPSFIPHKTVPFTSEEERISVAFDVVPQ